MGAVQHLERGRPAAGPVGVDTVYHCAAMADAPGSLEDFEEANVRGTLRLTRLAAEAGVRTLVYVSSISVYAKPPRGSRYLDERAAYDARAGERGAYTQSKLAADRALLRVCARAFAAAHRAPAAGHHLRAGRQAPVGRFTLPSPSADRPLVAGGGGVPMPLVHIDNVIDAMRLAGARRGPPVGQRLQRGRRSRQRRKPRSRTLRAVSGGRVRPVLLPYPLVWSLMLAVDVLTQLRRKGRWAPRATGSQRTLADMRYRSDAARQERLVAERDARRGAGAGSRGGAGRPFPH